MRFSSCDELKTFTVLEFSLFADLKRRSDEFSKAIVLHRTRDVDERVDFSWISLSISEAPFGRVGLDYLTDNQGMASQVEVVDCLTFQVYRAFFNEGRCFELAIEGLEDLRFVF